MAYVIGLGGNISPSAMEAKLKDWSLVGVLSNIRESVFVFNRMKYDIKGDISMVAVGSTNYLAHNSSP